VGLAVPTAIVVASGVGAKLGILFKTGPAMETCHRVNTVVFDKTGTLTQGKAAVVAWKSIAKDWDSDRFWHLVGSIESASEHSIAKCLVSYARAQMQIAFEEVDSLESLPGRGLSCSLEGQAVLVGNKSLIVERKAQLPRGTTWEILDKHVSVACGGFSDVTLVFVAVRNQVVGWIALQDIVKQDAFTTVNHLVQQGIDVWILSGDSNEATQRVGMQLHLDPNHVRGGLLPQDKANVIKSIQEEGRVVAMVGDGINDSPALTTADIGIAVARSTDVAIGAANVVLLQDDLFLVLTAIELSKATYRRILINFGWAFLYNITAVPFAAGFFYPIFDASIPPAFAGLSELLSSLPVVIFSVLLRTFTPSLSHTVPLPSKKGAKEDNQDSERTPLLKSEGSINDDS
jgi:Cu+-exporting ATPase